MFIQLKLKDNTMNSVRKQCALARERKTKETRLAAIAKKLRNST
jgi:hypothetical protein